MASCDMSYHLIQCGSKTRQCPNCERYICRANYNYHIDNQCIDLDEDNSFPKDHFISDRNNDIQTNDDDEFIPCEFCNEQIKFTSYDSHTV